MSTWNIQREIGSLKVLPEEELNGLNTKRLLAYKKSVLAQKSALYNKNKDTLKIEHPFDISKHISKDFYGGQYIVDTQLKELVKEAEDYRYLCRYHEKIKDILSSREHMNRPI